jgi:hypothetical protein
MGDLITGIDISETSIAQDALKRGGAGVNDTYKVQIEMTERETPSGGYRMDYKVKKVHEFIPGQKSSQPWLL